MRCKRYNKFVMHLNMYKSGNTFGKNVFSLSDIVQVCSSIGGALFYFWREIKMKKYIYGIIVLLILFGVSACGKKQTYVVTFDSLGGTPLWS